MDSAGIFVVRLERHKLIRCKKCHKILIDKDHLERHNEWHDLEERLARPGVMEHMESARVVLDRVIIYRCTSCTRGFLNYFHLNDHQKQHTKKNNTSPNVPEESNNNDLKPNKCDECGLRFVEKSTLTTHLKVHEPFPNVCYLCGVGFYQKKDLEYHGRLVHPTATDWKPVINYTGRKIKSEFAVEPSPLPSESEADDSDADRNYKPSTSTRAKPRLKAQLVFRNSKMKRGSGTSDKVVAKSKKKVKRENKENLFVNEGRKYECPHCGQICRTKLLYLSHVNTHTGELSHVCDRCPRAFSTRAFLIVHKQTHGLAADASSKCGVCHKVMRSKSGLQTHMLTHTGERPHSCRLCPLKFSQRGSLRVHMRIHDNVFRFQCKHCQKQFREKHGLTNHMRTHTGERPHCCPYCGKAFADASAFKRHKRIHTGEKPYRCALCPKAFSDCSAYIVHKRRHEGARFACPLCGKTFTSRNNLTTHTGAVHERIYKYQCAHCARNFANKGYLIAHIKTVHEPQIKRYRCQICDKTFFTKQNRNKHALNHEVLSRDHACEYCGMTFKTKTSRDGHLVRLHDRPDHKYECDHCHSKFVFKDDIYKHIRRHHIAIQCPKCKRYVSNSSELRDHQCVKCTVCDRHFRSKQLMEEHSRRHFKTKIHKCVECQRPFQGQKSLNSHVQRCHVERYCDKCGRSFKKKNLLVLHIWSKHMIGLYCSICMRRFFRESDLKRHKVTCSVARVKCDICGCECQTKLHLKRHLLKHHKPNNGH